MLGREVQRKKVIINSRPLNNNNNQIVHYFFNTGNAIFAIFMSPDTIVFKFWIDFINFSSRIGGDRGRTPVILNGASGGLALRTSAIPKSVHILMYPVLEHISKVKVGL